MFGNKSVTSTTVCFFLTSLVIESKPDIRIFFITHFAFDNDSFYIISFVYSFISPHMWSFAFFFVPKRCLIFPYN